MCESYNTKPEFCNISNDKSTQLCKVNTLQIKQIQMKTHTLSLVITLFLLTFVPSQVKAVTDGGPTPAAITVEEAQASVWLARLDEIQAMDKSLMTRSARKELRQEVRTLKANLKAVSGGVYLSVGAIILVVLLLVLLL